METIIGDYIGTTIGIHSPIPYTKNQTANQDAPVTSNLLLEPENFYLGPSKTLKSLAAQLMVSTV